MTPRVTLDTAEIPGGGQLRLIQRGSEFSIMLGANELMNSRLSGSEEALAALSCGPVAGRSGARVLIGGLGMGFTLRAALDVLGADAEVVVAELVPAVVAWARGPLAEVFAGSMDDPRVRIIEDDVRRPIGEGVAAFDAIMLDVDNGPDGLTRGSNDRLYGAAGLGAARRALRPGGNLAVWSSAPDPRFTRALQDAGFVVVEEVVVKARGSRGARHVIWVATRA
jgi:spermidine synthase